MIKKIRAYFSYPDSFDELIRRERRELIFASLVYIGTSALITFVLYKVGIKKNQTLFFILALNALVYFLTGVWICFFRNEIQQATLKTIKKVKIKFHKISAFIPLTSFSILAMWIAIDGDLMASIKMILYFVVPVLIMHHHDQKELDRFLAARIKEQI